MCGWFGADEIIDFFLVHDELSDSRMVDVFCKRLFIVNELQLVLGELVNWYVRSFSIEISRVCTNMFALNSLLEKFIAFESSVEKHWYQ